MIDSYKGKVAFFTKEKKFDGGYGEMCERFSEADVYTPETSDKGIIEQFDKEYQTQIEIWNVKVTYETVKD